MTVGAADFLEGPQRADSYTTSPPSSFTEKKRGLEVAVEEGRQKVRLQRHLPVHAGHPPTRGRNRPTHRPSPGPPARKMPPPFRPRSWRRLPPRTAHASSTIPSTLLRAT